MQRVPVKSAQSAFQTPYLVTGYWSWLTAIVLGGRCVHNSILNPCLITDSAKR